MADKDLTKKLLKAFDPNFLLKQQQLFIARGIDSSAKLKAAANYLRRGVSTVFRSGGSKRNKSARTKLTRKNKKSSK